MGKRIGFILFVGVIAVSCGTRAREEAPARPVGEAVSIPAPPGLPPAPIPEGNPPTAEAIALGRRLFYEQRLSSDETLSCAGCHRPDAFFADGLAVAKGVAGQLGPRNTPTVLNAAYSAAQFWDGRAASLEKQAGDPIANPKEMNLPHEVCLSRLEADEGYREDFARVFGPGPVTMEKVGKAIASFERTLLSGNSPFDRYRYGGEKTAMSAAAIRGLGIFTDRGRGNCAACHIVGGTFALFTDGRFHNLGAGMDSNGELKDLGRFEQTRAEADRGAFRTPSLRNVARTAPYMHDGSLKTLKDVIDFYIGGGSSNPQLDPEIRPLALSARDRDDLLAFLESLTGEAPANAGPPGR
ncbi:MAG: cytochrome-c peroxidase [Blastocatellia bacterium]